MGARTAPAPRLVELFLDMLASERGGAKNTLAAYSRDLEDLSSFLAGNRRTVATATTADLRSYLGDLAERSFKPASVARRLSAIR
jgi:integrase/recombinase XerD